MPALYKNPQPLRTFWSTTDRRTVRLYHGNVTDVLARLPAKSVQCIVTSPPYWGLRNYKAGSDEIGQERTPDEYVARMVEVGRGLMRVLRDDGVFWLNLGDTFSGGTRGTNIDDALSRQERKSRRENGDKSIVLGAANRRTDIPSGNLVGIPWRVALALQADGWTLRMDNVWHKPNQMPESVDSRCSRSHEYVFQFTKSMDYFYDHVAIEVPAVAVGRIRPGVSKATHATRCEVRPGGSPPDEMVESFSKNRRSVWTIPVKPYPGAHFATFPPDLPEICIKAGTSERGACPACGAPWVRVVEKEKLKRERLNDYVKRTGEDGTGNSCANSVAGVRTKTIDWRPSCDCGREDVVPCVVLDPFVGSGTTCCVAVALGRHAIGVDLSEKYLGTNAVPRIVGEIADRPALAHLVSFLIAGGPK